MGISGEINKFSNCVKKFKDIDGKIIGEDGEIFNEELASSDRQAWINHLSEQHLKHEPLDVPPPDFEITMRDIVKELTRREIIKIFSDR